MHTGNPILDYLMEIITLKNVIIFAILYFLVIWLSILIWVIKDITNRTDSLFLLIISILIIIIFNIFGLLLYIIIRPNKTLSEQYKLEIESNLQYLGEEVIERIGKKNLNMIKCKRCSKQISVEFKYCPYCKKKIDILEINDSNKKKKKKTK